MTAHEYTEFTLRCDKPGCRAKFGPRSIARAALRKLAVKAGWTHVRSWSGRKHDEDYCPHHNPDLAIRVRAALEDGGWAAFSSRADAGKVILNAPGHEGSWRSLVTAQCASYLNELGFGTQVIDGSLYVSEEGGP